jgi:hypothetical protein
VTESQEARRISHYLEAVSRFRDGSYRICNMAGTEEKRRNTYQQLDGKELFQMLLDYGRIA